MQRSKVDCCELFGCGSANLYNMIFVARQVLDAFAAWLVSQKKDGWDVVDIRPSLRESVAKAKAARTMDPAKRDQFGFMLGSLKAKAAAMYAVAQKKMDDEFDKIERQMGEIIPLKVTTHVTSRTG